MESTSKILAIVISCILGLVSQIGAQEKNLHQPDRRQKEVSPEQQEEIKDIPTITNPAIFDEKDLDKLLKKQREYVKKYYPDYRIVGEGQEQDYFDSRHYSEFDLKNENDEWVMIIRFDIEEAYQAYMKKHQKEIEREAAKLIKQGIIKIE